MSGKDKVFEDDARNRDKWLFGRSAKVNAAVNNRAETSSKDESLEHFHVGAYCETCGVVGLSMALRHGGWP